MRPVPGGEPAVTRSRKSSVGDQPTPQAASAVPTSFFVTQDPQEQQAVAGSQEHGESHGGQMNNSTFGVQSLSDALDEAFGDGTSSGIKNEPSSAHQAVQLCHRADHTPTSTPLTPVYNVSPAVNWSGMIPSTPKSSMGSFRLSDEGSRFDLESEDERHGPLPNTTFSPNMAEQNVPKFRMPSLSMPARRPFTERGMQMGRMKICVTGREGTGKSSLIQAIFNQCPDIVHLDQFQPSTSLIRRPSGKSTSSTRSRIGATEILASTKPFPSWWLEPLEDWRTLKRRKSSHGDVVLERNLCFVDTTGVDVTVENCASQSVISNLGKNHAEMYIEENMRRTDSFATLDDLERVNLLSGNGSSLVDVVLFLFSSSDDLKDDLYHFQQLSSLTNVVPLIAKADHFDQDELQQFKIDILQGINSQSRPFLFGKSVDTVVEELSIRPESASPDQAQEKDPTPAVPSQPVAHPPFGICSLVGNDDMEMDASKLMASAYTPPLVPSELGALIDQLFEPDNMRHLRHSAARKFLVWRSSQLESLAGFSSGSLSMSGSLENTNRDRTSRSKQSLNKRSSATDANSKAGADHFKKGFRAKHIKGAPAKWARVKSTKHDRLREIDVNDPFGLIKLWNYWHGVAKVSIGGGLVIGLIVFSIYGTPPEWANPWGSKV